MAALLPRPARGLNRPGSRGILAGDEQAAGSFGGLEVRDVLASMLSAELG
jgi:hypothetical protein